MQTDISERVPADGIVLLAKMPGLTSFASLNNVKKSLSTKKVGHTGTLDSFAQGLLVVCTGRLTKLAGKITEFDKSYSAVIKFGEERDTLEYTGNLVKKTPLPDLESLKNALNKFTGDLWQAPPAFSSIHVDGKRASDLARKGIEVEIPKRRIKVFSAELRDYKLSDDKSGVLYARIDFSVSKGTYIRCLARDIALECKSSAHLIGLLRTRVGNFKLSDAAGFDLLKDFTIENAMEAEKSYREGLKKEDSDSASKDFDKSKKSYIPSDEDLQFQKEIKEKILGFSEETSLLCGFKNLHLKNEKVFLSFKNGKPLNRDFFIEKENIEEGGQYAVFFGGSFSGLICRNEKKLSYLFVIA